MTLIELHMTKLEPTKKCIRRWLSRLGLETLEDLLTLQQADTGGKGQDRTDELEQFTVLRTMIEEILAEESCLSLKDLAVSGNDLLALGFEGRQIGEKLQYLLEQVLDEQLPNEKTALLSALNKEETL